MPSYLSLLCPRAWTPLLLAASLLAGCATVDKYVPTVRSFGVYKLDINQGNYVTADMVDKLKVGQTKGQVRTVLGTPLITSAFRENRWDYVYEYSRQGRRLEHRALAVYFDNETLARWEGDEMPASAAELNRNGPDKSMALDDGDDSGILNWMRGLFGGK